VKNGKNLASKQKDLANMYKGFILDKLFAPLLVPHYEGQKKNLPYIDTRLEHVTLKYSMIPKPFYFPLLTCSHIWLKSF